MIRSILFDVAETSDWVDRVVEPDYFRDLNLDQIVDAIAATYPEHRLSPYFWQPLDDPDLVRFRQQVFMDFQRPETREVVDKFTAAMRATRRRLGLLVRLHHRPQHDRWFIDAAIDYYVAVKALADELASAALSSPGLRAIGDDVATYVSSPGMTAMHRDAVNLRTRLGEVRYELLLRDDTVTVKAANDHSAGEDFSAEVLKTFARFGQRVRPNAPNSPDATGGMSSLEADILDVVAAQHPAIFADLAAFRDRHRRLVRDDVARLDRELHFYLGYLDYLAPIHAADLPTCHPVITDGKQERGYDVFDLALAAQLTTRHEVIVTNDFRLAGSERILVVSGPNQGGKTTMARTFGQLHYLAALGCAVPGNDVVLQLPDRLFTHFDKEEDLDTSSGKLMDELRRMHAILERATSRSVIVLNEVFSSTTLSDARILSRRILSSISDLDALCICVSFVDELATLNLKTVSMVSIVVPGDPPTRTFKIVRAPADGHAHAQVIAYKHGLTYDQLSDRIRA